MKSYFWLSIFVSVFIVGGGSAIPSAQKLQELAEESPRFYDSIKFLYCYFKYDVIPVECLPTEVQLYLKFTGKLPESRDTVATQFRLFTRRKRDEPEYITNLDISSWNLKKSTFNPKLETKFITHGYFGADAPWAVTMKDAFLNKEDCNVFIVDWDGGDGPIYPQAYANVRVVGFEIGLFIQYLKNNTNLRPQDVHLIGHSLGAHASGFGGKVVQQLTNQKVGRITGLDPAGPSFYDLSPEERLDASDAIFVDAIHTNLADNFASGFGIPKPVGHFDFYPNGGEDQPGCAKRKERPPATVGEQTLNFALSIVSPLSAPDVKDAIVDTTTEVVGSICSHGKAYEFFIASIEDSGCKFASLECSSWEDYTTGKCGSCSNRECISMGYKADQFRRRVENKPYRKFYLSTRARYPFCMEKP